MVPLGDCAYHLSKEGQHVLSGPSAIFDQKKDLFLRLFAELHKQPDQAV